MSRLDTPLLLKLLSKVQILEIRVVLILTLYLSQSWSLTKIHVDWLSIYVIKSDTFLKKNTAIKFSQCSNHSQIYSVFCWEGQIGYKKICSDLFDKFLPTPFDNFNFIRERGQLYLFSGKVSTSPPVNLPVWLWPKRTELLWTFFFYNLKDLLPKYRYPNTVLKKWGYPFWWWINFTCS